MISPINSILQSHLNKMQIPIKAPCTHAWVRCSIVNGKSEQFNYERCIICKAVKGGKAVIDELKKMEMEHGY